MSRENGWGAPRIHGELQMLGIDAAQATVAKYMRPPRKPPSQTCRTFLDNHVKALASVISSASRSPRFAFATCL
jgi:hypothetical protein